MSSCHIRHVSCWHGASGQALSSLSQHLASMATWPLHATVTAKAQDPHIGMMKSSKTVHDQDI